ncbi:F-box/WD repeat-containing protein 8-like [Dermacentor albipictus]|uniref:F-box/WD repeat-containing protein 8-like n=1 Tax=Dermacentor albipictus TaxID=60249 RepID=UPI0038FD28F0
MVELDRFRSQWLRELKVDAARKPVGPEDLVGVVIEGLRADDANVDNEDRLVRVDCDGGSRTVKHAAKRRLIKLESNTLCQEQPRAFDIADRLLQGEILTDDDLFGKCEEKKRALGTTTPVECSEVPAAPARLSVENACSSLVDTFINDLNEITEIPFFDTYLPREVAIDIFKHLDIVDLCRCAQVSRGWRCVADDELLWHRHCCQMGFADETVTAEKTNWKQYLKDQMQRESLLRHNWKNRIGRLYELEYSRAGVLSAVDSSEDFILAGYSSGEVRLWQRTSSGVQLRSVILDGTIHPNSLNYVSSVALAKSCFVVTYAEGEVCVGGLSGCSTSATACNQTIALIGPAKVAASKQDNHFAAFGGTSIALVDPAGQIYSAQLPTKVSHVALLPTACGRQQPPLVSAAEDAVRLHARHQFEADGLSLHHLIGATVTCLDCSDAVIALGLTDRSAVNVFQVPLYAAENGRLLGTLTSHTSSVVCVNVSHCPDNLVLTGSCDKNARIFDLRTLQCEVRISAHGLGVTQVQMDEHSLVTGGQDGLVCVWDLRTKAKLWEMFCRHPVKHLRANRTTLVTAHVPYNLFPEPEDGNIVVHTRQRGSIRMYDFSANQQTSGIPSICLSSYDEPAGYNYNVRLAVPYDEITDVI